MRAATMISNITAMSHAALQETGYTAPLKFYLWRIVRARMLRYIGAVPLAGPAALFDLGFAIAGRFERRAQNEMPKPASDPADDHLLYMLPQAPGTTLDQTMSQTVDEWAQSSLLMAQTLHGLGISYLHILHPNQYFSKKVFTDEEERIAISLGNGYAQRIHETYPRMLEEGKKLAAAGVDFVSAVDIFDKESETIYTDECCHFNAPGNLLLGRFMAAHIPASR